MRDAFFISFETSRSIKRRRQLTFVAENDNSSPVLRKTRRDDEAIRPFDVAHYCISFLILTKETGLAG